MRGREIPQRRVLGVVWTVIVLGCVCGSFLEVEGASTGGVTRKNELTSAGGPVVGGIKGRRRCVSFDDNVQIAHGGTTVVASAGGGEEEATYVDDSEDSSMMVTEMVCAKESQFCYALWRYTANGTREWMKQGCWEASSTTPSCLNSQCVMTVKKGNKAGQQQQQETTTAAAVAVGVPGGGEQTSVQQQPQPPFFCCCDRDNCNSEAKVVYVDPVDDEESSSEDDELGDELGGGHKKLAIVLLILVGSIISGVMILGTGYRYWGRLHSRRQRKDGGGGELDGDTGEDGDGDVIGLSGEGKLLLLGGGHGEGESLLGEDTGLLDGIQLVVLLARGKFASVYEGRIASLSDAPFALKCFAKEQKEFFENERFVFNYLGKHCNHDNIIKYYGWQEFTVGPTTHLILVLDKICPGSLRDFLQSITMSTGPGTGGEQVREVENGQEAEVPFKIADVLRICSGIASGLSYLHGENRDEIVIAHRDLTSKNILLDASSLTPKITDYGLSLVTRGSKYYWAGRERQAEFCSLAEAGTLRYMAPELLEGAVNLKDCENALKQADVYALALILWEVANCSHDVRLTQAPPTSPQEGGETGVQPPLQPLPVQHNLPYEEEIGKDNLSMDALSRHVVQYRQRPHFRRWRDSPYTRQLRDTLIESWDAEPDARLTALCIVERLHDIRNIRLKNSDISTSNNRASSGIIHHHHPHQALQSPLESPTSGLFGPDGTGPIIIDSPWTGRNPCLQRNLLANNTATSTTSGGGGNSSEGLSTSGSILSDTTGGGGIAHPLLLNHFDLAKNQANLNFYHNYVGGSSGGTSYTGSTTGGGGNGTGGGNATEVSNVSSVTDERVNGGHVGGISISASGRCPPSQSLHASGHGPNPVGHHPLPPAIPFLQNLHN